MLRFSRESEAAHMVAVPEELRPSSLTHQRRWTASAIAICAMLATLGSACGSATATPKGSRSSGAETPRAAKPLAATRKAHAKGEEPDRRFHMQATFWMAITARDALI